MLLVVSVIFEVIHRHAQLRHFIALLSVKCSLGGLCSKSRDDFSRGEAAVLQEPILEGIRSKLNALDLEPLAPIERGHAGLPLAGLHGLDELLAAPLVEHVHVIVGEGEELLLVVGPHHRPRHIL